MTAPYGLTQFEFDENDLADDKVWFCDVTHGTPPWKPLYMTYGWSHWYTKIEYWYEWLSVPASRGWDVRIRDGYCYVGVMLTSEEEAKARAKTFRERIRPFLEDFKGSWNKDKQDLAESYDNTRAKYALNKYEDITRISTTELFELWEDYMWKVNAKQWDVHVKNFTAVYYLYGLFESMTRETFGIDSAHPLFARLMSGFDSSSFEFNRKIWGIGRRAIDLGLEDIFMNTEDPDLILDMLEESDGGRNWLKEYREFLDVYGWRCERMLEWATPTWLEKPSLGIPLVRLAVTSGASSGLEEKQEEAKRDRKLAESEFLALVPEDKKGLFGAMMQAAQMAGYWTEDHNYYCDLYTNAMGRWITHEIGRRFAEVGALDDAEDIYFLVPGEIYKGLIPMGRVRLQQYAAARKREWESYLTKTPEMLLGNRVIMAEVARRDPVISAAASVPKVREDVRADLYGSASVPGLAEGPARVVMTERELAALQPGEILVAPGTSSQWTPVFEIAKAIVTDGGGALSHAVIVAREYGIPAVTGCQDATRKIKTGDRVRVDGDLGIVSIIS